jgi:succinyl-CoA synthetase beta subunit
MNIHEYQAKKIFAEYAIPIPAGTPAFNTEEAVTQAQQLGGDAWMIKAQVHAGGRGKAGGVKKVTSLTEVQNLAAQLLGSTLVTPQNSPAGQPVNAVLIETPVAIARELYLSILVDRACERVRIIASPAGGMDIETVAATEPHKIFSTVIDPAAGLQAYQCRELGFKLGLDLAQVKQFSALLNQAYRLFSDKDLSLLEINPLIVTKEGAVMALDAKINLDDNALFRHPDLSALYDPSQNDAKEDQARAFDLNYVALDGDIACMVNGAGLAMATMDIIKLHGGNPANFLDVGGGTTAAKVTEAFKLILADHKVKAILVNIFGGIVRCDLIAEGIIQAAREVDLPIPVVVRLEGTNVIQGKRLLADSGLRLIPANDLSEAARKAVAAAQGQGVVQ